VSAQDRIRDLILEAYAQWEADAAAAETADAITNRQRVATLYGKADAR
jgi:hypothetical protein